MANKSATNKALDSETLDPTIYQTTWLRSVRFVLILSALAILSFFFFWGPVKNLQGTIVQFAQRALGCSLTLDAVEMGMFLPRLELKQLHIPAGCLSPTQRDVDFKEIDLYFAGFSLSPLGPVLKLILHHDTMQLPAKVTLGASTMAVAIQDEFALLPLSRLLKDILGIELELTGKMDVDFRATLKNQQMDLMLLKAKGKQVRFQKVSLYGFTFPEANLQDMAIHAEGKNGNIRLQKLTLGRRDKDLYLDAHGDLKLPAQPMGASSVDVKMQFFLSERLLKEFSIIDMVLANYKSGAAGNYQFNVKGSLEAPQLTK